MIVKNFDIYKSMPACPGKALSIVAYEDIVQYDLRGDEHYICPHFFCKFRHKGGPFIEDYYLTLDNSKVPYYFDESSRKIF